MLNGDRLLTPAEVGALFRVDPKTVSRWGNKGRLGCVRTPGGHRRFRESEVRALLEGDGQDDQAAAVPAPRAADHDQVSAHGRSS